MTDHPDAELVEKVARGMLATSFPSRDWDRMPTVSQQVWLRNAAIAIDTARQYCAATEAD